MVNKLLAEYQKVGEKLPYICKKGCCIKQRQIIENAKTKFYDKLKRISSQISSNEKKWFRFRIKAIKILFTSKFINLSIFFHPDLN